jgi:hypothetical protein
MNNVQKALSIGDEAPSVNTALVEFIKKIGEVAF